MFSASARDEVLMDKDCREGASHREKAVWARVPLPGRKKGLQDLAPLCGTPPTPFLSILCVARDSHQRAHCPSLLLAT